MEYCANNDYRDYLSHHGVLGMKWGVRRYQPYSIGYQRKGGVGGKMLGLARAADNAKKKVGNFVKKTKKSIATKRRVAKAKATRAKKQKAAALREKILKSGSAKELLAAKNKFNYTNKEIDNAINRLNTEYRLKDLKTQEMMRKADNAKIIADKIVGYARTGIAVYDVVKDIKKRRKDAKQEANNEKYEKLVREGKFEDIFNKRTKLSDSQLERAASRQKNLMLLQDYNNKTSKSDGQSTKNSQADEGTKNDQSDERRLSPEERGVKMTNSDVYKPTSEERAREQSTSSKMEKITSPGSDLTSRIRITDAEQKRARELESSQNRPSWNKVDWNAIARDAQAKEKRSIFSKGSKTNERRRSPEERAREQSTSSKMEKITSPGSDLTSKIRITDAEQKRAREIESSQNRPSWNKVDWNAIARDAQAKEKRSSSSQEAKSVIEDVLKINSKKKTPSKLL